MGDYITQNLSSAKGNIPSGVGVQLQIGGASGLILIVSLAADHGGVVPAPAQLGEEQPVPALPAGPLQVAAVGGHAPAAATLP